MAKPYIIGWVTHTQMHTHTHTHTHPRSRRVRGCMRGGCGMDGFGWMFTSDACAPRALDKRVLPHVPHVPHVRRQTTQDLCALSVIVGWTSGSHRNHRVILRACAHAAALPHARTETHARTHTHTRTHAGCTGAVWVRGWWGDANR
jgi:hypothetical protein